MANERKAGISNNVETRRRRQEIWEGTIIQGFLNWQPRWRNNVCGLGGEKQEGCAYFSGQSLVSVLPTPSPVPSSSHIIYLVLHR